MELNRTSLIKMGKFIADLRKRKKYTQKQLAELLDVSDKTVSKWEQGILAPDITLLKSLAQALDTNIDSIVNGENCKGIFKYNNEAKKHKLIIIFFIFTIVVALFSFYMGGKGKFDLHKLQSHGVFKADGYIINSDNESILVIENIKLNDSNDKIKNKVFKYASIEIYSDEKIVSTKNFNIGKSFTLQEFLNDASFILEDKVKIEKSKLKIKINLYSLGDVKYEFIITFTQLS